MPVITQENGPSYRNDGKSDRSIQKGDEGSESFVCAQTRRDVLLDKAAEKIAEGQWRPEKSKRVADKNGEKMRPKSKGPKVTGK